MHALTYFPIQRLLFTIHAEERISLPYFPGSALHGILGDMLLPTHCRSDIKGSDPPCDHCLRRPACAFACLYKASVGHVPGSGKMQDYPRPYLVNPTPVAEKGLNRGDFYHFEIVLIGNATGFAMAIVEAFLEAGAVGITGKKAKFEVSSVSVSHLDGNQTIYADGHIGMLPPPDNVVIPLDVGPCGEAALSFITPLRFKEQGQLIKKAPSFALLIKNLLTRACRLSAAYCNPPAFSVTDTGQDCENTCPFNKDIHRCPDSEFCHQLMTKSEGISISDDQSFWVDPYRYSSRQDKWMNTGGLVGGITYQGDLAPFIPLMKLGEAINIGKMTTMGLGKYHLEY